MTKHIDISRTIESNFSAFFVSLSRFFRVLFIEGKTLYANKYKREIELKYGVLFLSLSKILVYFIIIKIFKADFYILYRVIIYIKYYKENK